MDPVSPVAATDPARGVTDNLADAAALAGAMWNGPMPLAVVDHTSSRVLAANGAMVSLLGTTVEAMVGRTDDELGIWYEPDARRRFFAIADDDLGSSGGEISIRAADGTPRQLFVALTPVRYEGLDCRLVQVIDISAQAELRAATERQRQRLLAVLSGLPVGVVVQAAPTGEISLANQAACDILGLSMDQLTGRTSTDPRWRAIRQDGSIFPGDEHPAMVTLRTGESVDGAIMGVHRPDNDLVWIAVSSRMAPLAGPDGGEGVVTAFIDITVLEQTRADLLAAKERAEEADIAKSNFLSVVSHELRTPLTAVIGYSQMLLGGPEGSLTPQQQDDLQQIARGADRLLALIDDLLDLGRIQGDRLELEMEPVDLGALLRRLEPDFRIAAGEKSLEFSMSVEPGLDVEGDPLRLEQVFINLVGNAVKFTQHGEVTVHASRDGDSAAVSVTDSGIGIPADAQARIFEMFQQGDSTTTRRYGGMGLGLAIASRIAERHGGELSVESEVGRGSTFTVRIPLRTPGD